MPVLDRPKLSQSAPAFTKLPHKPGTQRVVSLLPFLTDIVTELKAGGNLVAASHDCASAANVPAVTRPRLHISDADSPDEISCAWQFLCAAGREETDATNKAHDTKNPTSEALTRLSIDEADRLLRDVLCSYYSVDVVALRALSPSVILTHVAVPRGEPDNTVCIDVEPRLRAALRVALPTVMHVLSCDARSLHAVLQLQTRIADGVGVAPSALSDVHTRLQARLRAAGNAVRTRGARLGAKRVGVVQWSDPLYIAGGWVHDAVIAGGGNNGRDGGFDSDRGRDRDEARKGAVAMHACAALVEYDVLVFALCGLNLRQCARAVAHWWGKYGFICGEGGPIGDRPTVVVTDARQLFSSMSAERVAQAAEVVAEIVGGANWFGHHRVLWDYWQPE